MKATSSSKLALPPAIVLAGDLLCFLIFALLGLRSHEDGITGSGLLRAAVPFQLGWLAVSVLLGMKLGRADVSEPQRVLVTWLPAWAIGLALRSLVFGRAFAPTFAAISFLVNAVLLLIWRAVIVPRIVRKHEPS